LLLSPDHAVYAEGVLIPIRHLTNDTTIVQEELDEVTYYHVELARHEVILAEGLPCESYLDVNDRRNFANGGLTVKAHPAFGTGAGTEAIWEAQGYAPMRIEGAAVNRVAARLRRRAKILGFRPGRTSRRRAAMRGATTVDLNDLLRPDWYLATNPDVAAAGIGAREHYIGWGRKEGRRPCPEIDLIRALGLIDPGMLAMIMPDVIEAGFDPVKHFCSVGWTERRPPNPYFDTGWYRDTYDVPQGMNPLFHYVVIGENQGFAPSPHFDPVWYRQRYGLAPSVSPLAHYLQHRRAQKLSPLPSFDVAAYIKAHTATLRPDRDPYAHYLAMGQFTDSEERRAVA
jgi:hypothetical protein